MRKLQVKDVLTRIKEPIELEDYVLYKRVTIKTKHQGVFLRDSQYGKDIGTKKQFLINKGQFLLSKIDARNGAFGIVPDEVDGAIITGNFWTYEVNEKELNIELFYIMTSLPFFDELCKNASSGSTNRQYLDEKKFLNQEITLPPIEEQNSFIEHFKKLQEKHSQTLEELQTQSKLISKLRSSILSDAIHGKLTEEWRKNITLNNEIIYGYKNNNLHITEEDNQPFEIPNTWIWIKLDNLVNQDRGITYGIVKMGKEPTKDGIVALRCSDVKFRRIDIANARKVTKEISNQYKRTILEGGEILLNIRGTLGGCGIVDSSLIGCNIAREIGMIPISNHEFTDYILNVLTSPYFDNQIENNLRGIAYKGLNLNILRSFPIPLPPLEEQKRIVEKVEKLMATCDALELEVQNSKRETKKLMQSVLEEAFI